MQQPVGFGLRLLPTLTLRTDGVYKPVGHDAAATKATEEAASRVGNDGAPYCWTTNSCWGKFEDYETYVDAFVEAYDPQILCFDVRQRAPFPACQSSVT